MVEATVTCPRICFLKYTFLQYVIPRLPTDQDVMMLLLRMGSRDEMSKFAAFSGCTYTNGI